MATYAEAHFCFSVYVRSVVLWSTLWETSSVKSLSCQRSLTNTQIEFAPTVVKLSFNYVFPVIIFILFFDHVNMTHVLFFDLAGCLLALLRRCCSVSRELRLSCGCVEKTDCPEFSERASEDAWWELFSSGELCHGNWRPLNKQARLSEKYEPSFISSSSFSRSWFFL